MSKSWQRRVEAQVDRGSDPVHLTRCIITNLESAQRHNLSPERVDASLALARQLFAVLLERVERELCTNIGS